MSGLYDIDGNDVYSKLINVSFPELFGAVGDGTTDDTTAVQNAINQKGLILFSANKQYKITDTLRIGSNTILDLNGATIVSTTKHLLYNFKSTDTSFTGYNGNGDIIIRNGKIVGGAISFGHGKDILLENVLFSDSLNDHFLEIAGCNNYVIRGCRFVGMADVQTSVYEYINIDPCIRGNFPWLPDGSAFYDGTINDGIEITDCYFDIGTDSYAYGFNAIGVHSTGNVVNKHKNIRIINNDIQGFTGCGLRINHMNNVLIADNIINVSASGANGIRVGDIAQSTNVIIKNNVITSSGTAITKANNSTVFQSTDNDINPTFS